MPKLILTCDEVWPVFDLVIPEEGQEANCECPAQFYREYLEVSVKYQKFQRIIRAFYDEQERRYPDHVGGYHFPEGCIPMQHANHKIPLPSEQRLWPILHEDPEGVCGTPQPA